MQLYCLRVSRLEEQGKLTHTIAALAKMNNTVTARQVIADARDLLGGNGILLDYPVMRHMTDIEAIYTYEGTSTSRASSSGVTSPASAPSPDRTGLGCRPVGAHQWVDLRADGAARHCDSCDSILFRSVGFFSRPGHVYRVRQPGR